MCVLFRRDKSQRPELCKGSVELVAPGEYMVRPPQAPVYVFVMDVSYAAVASGMVAQVRDMTTQKRGREPANLDQPLCLTVWWLHVCLCDQGDCDDQAFVG